MFECIDESLTRAYQNIRITELKKGH